MLELIFEHQGTVNVPCDLTSEDFDLPIRGNEINCSFGEEFNNDNEELLIFLLVSLRLDIAHIYEMIVYYQFL
jgi:hypothetical protein